MINILIGKTTLSFVAENILETTNKSMGLGIRARIGMKCILQKLWLK